MKRKEYKQIENLLEKIEDTEYFISNIHGLEYPGMFYSDFENEKKNIIKPALLLYADKLKSELKALGYK